MAKGSGTTRATGSGSTSAARTMSLPRESVSLENWTLSSTEKRRLNNNPSAENYQQIRSVKNILPSLSTRSAFDSDIRNGEARRATPATIVKYLNEDKRRITDSYQKGVRNIESREREASRNGNTMLSAMLKKTRIEYRDTYQSAMRTIDSKIAKAKKLRYE